MTHPAICTLPFTLQLCYKPLGILQRVTKSEKVHISGHNELQKLHNINFPLHRSRSLLRERLDKQEFPPFHITFFLKEPKNLSLEIDSRYEILNEEQGWSLASHTKTHYGHSGCNTNFQNILRSDFID